MLKCDFCHLPWHQKCVDTPLITIPRMTYWMCPNHTESLLDSIWTGEQVTKEQRKKLYEKYRRKEKGLKQFKKFCKFTWKDRVENMLINQYEKLNNQQPVKYAPESDVLPTSSLTVRSPENRKERSKKGDSHRFLNRKYVDFGCIPEKKTTPKVVKTKRRSTEDSDSDDWRSRKFTDEELISSIMPFDGEYSERSGRIQNPNTF